MPATRILLVDDDVDLLASYRLYLEAAGYEVRTATSAAEGLELLEPFRPDLVTADLMMEHYDSGFSFCRQVKAAPATADTPVVMLTGVLRETGVDFSLRTRADRALIRADEVVTKPVSPQQLAAIISRHLAARGR